MIAESTDVRGICGRGCRHRDGWTWPAMARKTDSSTVPTILVRIASIMKMSALFAPAPPEPGIEVAAAPRALREGGAGPIRWRYDGADGKRERWR